MTKDDRHPDGDESGVPGTVDDIPLTFGQEVPQVDDSITPSTGGSSKTRPKESDEPGTADERELWRQQKALVEEDEKTGLKLDGFSEDEIPDILEAMGDDAAEPLQDYPNGTSATGLWSAPEHGGFPERKD